MTTPLERRVSDAPFNDAVLGFSAEKLFARGRVARLGPSIDQILKRHAYPEPVSRLVAQAAVLTVMLGATLKNQGRFQLQIRSDGPVDMIVVDFDAPDRLRAFARFDAQAVETANKNAGLSDSEIGAALLGRGHLGLTIEPGEDKQRYQGVAPLEGGGLEQAAQTYFRQSEQIPTFLKIAVGEEITPDGRHFRAGGLLVQFLPQSDRRAREMNEVDREDAWNEACLLAGTLRDDELLDETLSGERLLFRLFHENELKVFETGSVRDQCRCSRENMFAMLRNFPAEDRRDMVGDDGAISVSCEFCSTLCAFDPKDFGE